MNQLRVSTLDGRLLFHPGEDIVGAAAWELDKKPTLVQLNLCWCTCGESEEDVGVVEVVTFDNPKQQDAREFRFTLPDAPCSFRGNLFTLVWMLELVTKPSQESARLNFILSPFDTKVCLAALPDD